MISNITLCKYEFDGYKEERDFTNRDEQIEYFDILGYNNGIKLEDVPFDLRNDFFILQVNKLPNGELFDIFKFNFVFVDIEGETRRFYYRIIDVAQENDGAFRVFLELNIFQTFMWDYEFMPSSIEQQHENRWSKNIDKPIYKEPIDTIFSSDFFSKNEKQLFGSPIVLFSMTNKIHENDDRNQNIYYYFAPLLNITDFPRNGDAYGNLLNNLNGANNSCQKQRNQGGTGNIDGPVSGTIDTNMGIFYNVNISNADSQLSDRKLFPRWLKNPPKPPQVEDYLDFSFTDQSPSAFLNLFIVPQGSKYGLVSHNDDLINSEICYSPNYQELLDKDGNSIRKLFYLVNKNKENESYFSSIEYMGDPGSMFPRTRRVANCNGRDSKFYFVYMIDKLAFDDFSSEEIIEREIPIKPEENKIRNNKYEPQLYKAPFKRHFIFNGIRNNVFEIPDRYVGEDKVILQAKTIFAGGFASNLIGIKGFNAYQDEVSLLTSDTLDILSDEYKEYVNRQKAIDKQAMNDQILENFIGGSVGGFLNTAQWAVIWDNRTQNQIAKGKSTSYVSEGISKKSLGILAGLNFAGSAVQGAMDLYMQPRVLARKEQEIKNINKSILTQGSINQLLSSPEEISKIGYRYIMLTPSDKIIEQYSDFYFWYGYNVQRTEIPKIRTRKFFNFIRTRDCNIRTSLHANIKKMIEGIYNSGIRIWHKDRDELYDSEGNEYENLEVDLIG